MKWLVASIFMAFIASCGQAVRECPACKPQVIEKPIVTKCEVPEVPPAELEKIQEKDTYEERLRKLIKNYGLLKEENTLLRRAIEICK